MLSMAYVPAVFVTAVYIWPATSAACFASGITKMGRLTETLHPGTETRLHGSPRPGAGHRDSFTVPVTEHRAFAASSMTLVSVSGGTVIEMSRAWYPAAENPRSYEPWATFAKEKFPEASVVAESIMVYRGSAIACAARMGEIEAVFRYTVAFGIGETRVRMPGSLSTVPFTAYETAFAVTVNVVTAAPPPVLSTTV